MKRIILLITAGLFLSFPKSFGANEIPLKVENSSPGAPLTLGIPFPKGALFSPDHVRVLDSDGKEIPSQVTEVSTWQPADNSLKWIWVFFFAQNTADYTLQYGKDVSRAPIVGDRVIIINRQRTGEATEVITGPLRFKVIKDEGGFLDDVQLDLARDGFDEEDIIAESPKGRGSFLDILDDAGIDPSRAVVTRTVKEKGSGPLHAILKVEGTYFYSREDNHPSPFILRIHAYAGKSYIRVYHTLTYTGVPDKHVPMEGEHAYIATGMGKIIPEDRTNDPGWTQPNDRIAATGLSLKYRLSGKLSYKTGYDEGNWWETGNPRIYESKLKAKGDISVFQSGPKPDRIPPVPTSSTEKRLEGFFAAIKVDSKTKKEFAKAEGWTDISDRQRGISIGIRHFIEEYPKEIKIDINQNQAVAYLWSPNAGPMSFARWSNEIDQGMIDNFATGLTKTSELVYYFHGADGTGSSILKRMRYFLDPPIAHADPNWYAESKVYGQFSARTKDHEEFERSLDYRFDWAIFNQNWEPWYGMFDFGDNKNNYFNGDWHRWVNNEPAVDFMLWLQFMRTGKPKYYLAAEAMSRHAMDVDNIHWPADPKYYGGSNPALDYWKLKAKPSVATPYLGIGRRHAKQHWNALLSAHVWVQGWLASYYLTGYHRGLDIARLTADTYTKRIWGEHGLTGRRLYLSVWNMTEVWDATKDDRYFEDLKDRVHRMIRLQNGPDQYNSLVIDRYGYAQVYASHGLYKYYKLTGDEKVRTALIRHARAIRDNPPWNHEYESYFSTIHSLLVGYELSGEPSFLEEAKKRATLLKTDKLSASFEELGSQQHISDALLKASHLPKAPEYHEAKEWGVTIWGPTQGLRVFGWTHIYNVPWLLYWLRNSGSGSLGSEGN